MKRFEFVDRVVEDGIEKNLYMSLEDGTCYTFTDEEVNTIETAEANIARRRAKREEQKVIKARRSKRRKRILCYLLAAVMLLSLHTSLKEPIKEEGVSIFSPVASEDTFIYRDKLVRLLNKGEADYEKEDYRNLYYLYYNAYLSGNGELLLSSMVDIDNDTSLLSKEDFSEWLTTGKVNITSLIDGSVIAASAVSAENMDIFLNFNACLKREVTKGRLTMEDYMHYFMGFREALEVKDTNLARVWDYYGSNGNTIDGIIDVKLLCYEEQLRK